MPSSTPKAATDDVGKDGGGSSCSCTSGVDGLSEGVIHVAGSHFGSRQAEPRERSTQSGAPGTLDAQPTVGNG